MPTGVHIRDVRERLFAAAERVLVRDGPQALTSRVVTDEAGCAKGVLHRHFTDFDGFLAELVQERAARIEARAPALLGAAGTGTVAGNLAEELADLFGSVAAAVVPLVTFRDGLRARLRALRGPQGAGIPVLAEATEAIAAYLAAEQELGRVPPGADPGMLAPALVGAAHLRFADREGAAPEPDEVRGIVAAVLGQADQPGSRPL
ncbi:TetR/AcrR family transcriptional regulator [Nocardiopsis chromatogenes]|uniref:TetR/AcrR family transcriptional regulator n=1 Tax=Nocardiopsis chromatogenes TaxID=280239 RepID=UPI000346DC8C|nr:TetR/AcrR family transcriptional regulator [Nocardiopsis chromatogenes]